MKIESEKDVYEKLRKATIKHGGRYLRVENVLGDGTPDVNLAFPFTEKIAIEFWVECKFCEDAKRPTTSVLRSHHKVSPEQAVWHKKQWDINAISFFLVVTPLYIYTVEGSEYMTINDMSRIQLSNKSIAPIVCNLDFAVHRMKEYAISLVRRGL